MSSPMIYSYSCGQPDPEIWGGGETSVLFNITSGLEYSEKRSRKYNLEITPGSSATGLLSVSGASSEEHSTKNYTGNIQTYFLSNIGVEHVEYVPPINDVEFKVTGNSVTKHIVVKTIDSTITLTGSFSLEEKVGYSYNKNSSTSFSAESFGNISSSIDSSEDYGFINQTASQGDEDFGFVFNSIASTNPFGSISVSGSAIVVDPPNIKTYNTGANYRVVYNPPENTATLLNFGGQKESVSYDYNQDSINLVVQENNGLISNSVDEIENSGLIIDPVVGSVDYETIEITSTILSFGSININGSATTEYNNINFYEIFGIVKVVYSPDNTSGTLFGFGNTEERVSYDYNIDSRIEYVINDFGSISDSYGTNVETYELINGVVTSFDEYGFIEFAGSSNPFGSLSISGSASVEYINKNFYDNITSSKVRVAYSPDDTTGTLFGFGEKFETATYSYNLSSQDLLDVDDSGSIATIATQTVDFGFINENISGQESYGDLQVISSQIPFGTVSINGSADIVYYNANFYDNITSSKVRVAYSPDDTTGTLFGFGEKFEAFSYSYNQDSVLLFGIDEFGLITNLSSESDEFGYVNEVYSEQIDYGLDTGLGQTQTIYPFGNFNISGSSGNILLGYGQENTILFNISGELVHPNIDYTPAAIGVGTVQISGSSNNSFTRINIVSENISITDQALESRTHSYNESSIVLDVTPDFGLITNTISEISDDYGSVVGSDGETTEYGFISVGVQSQYPFGTITLSGVPLVYPEVDYTPKYTGSGTFNVSGAATYSETDAFGVGRRRGGTINLCGNALYSETDVYVGIGTIYISQTITESETESYVGFGTIFVSDAALTSDEDSFVGSGTLILTGTAAESFTGNTLDGTSLFVFSGELTHPNIDYTPHYGIEENIGVGTTGIRITALSSAQDSFSANTPENTQLFQIYGSGIESFTANPPENIQLFTISGFIDESETESYVGVAGTLVLSGSITERDVEVYVGLGTLQVSGVVNDAANRIARGTGSISIVNGFSPQESYPWLPEPGVGRSWSFTRTTYVAQPVSINISSGIALTHYYSPVYPRNALITDPSSGIGTIRINDDNELTLYRATLPYNARGTIFLSGIAPESFTESTFVGSGSLTFSGISSNREIAVYQGYVTGGLITISQQTAGIIEKNTEAYFGSGTIFVSQSLVEVNAESYSGSGTIFTLSGDSESYSAQTPEETVTITVSGSAQESFIAQTPEDTILYQFSGAATDEKLIKNYVGSGSAIISGSADVRATSSHLASGTIRFVKYTSDQNYDTCDSVDITSDNLYSAKVSFVANPPEDTVLFNINGNASTSETALYTETSVGLYTLSGTYQNIKLTHSEVGIGTVFITETSSQSEINAYIGSGTLFALSGKLESYSAQTPESTIIFQISGSALTSIESDYSIVGIGLFAFNGFAITSEITSYTNVGSGVITLSGQVIHPNVLFIPSPDGSGTINILGSSNKSLTKIYDDTSGTLFNFSSGFESFTKSTYTGFGTVYIEQTSSTTVNNPYQIPRVYVSII
jgi:hypothetical protein